MNALLQPLRLPAFRRLLGAYAINALGNWAGQIALSILVLQRTGSPAAVTAVMIAGQFLPALVAPRLVAAAETIGARVMLPILLAAESALFVLLAGLSRDGSLGVMLVVIAVDGVLGLAARALLKASLVAVTSPHGLIREGNALLIGVFTTCMAVGPILAGLAISIFSAQLGLMADAGSFALAAIALIGHVPTHSREDAANDGDGRVREAITHIRHQPRLRRLLGAYGSLCLASAAILPLEVVLVTRTLHANAGCLGTVLASWGIGATVGSAAVTRLRDRPLLPLLAFAFVLMAISYLGMGTAASATIVIAFSFLGGIGNGIEGFASLTAIQERTTPALQARIGGLVESITAASTGLGFLLGGLTATLGSVRLAYIISGLAILACATALRTPSKTPSASPAPEPATT
jgi:Transmembrane secretion effector